MLKKQPLFECYECQSTLSTDELEKNKKNTMNQSFKLNGRKDKIY
jgi:hypothetical protein